MFIVLEGIDGCGKTTHAKLLHDFLRDKKRDVLLTAEPTQNEIGVFIRKILSGLHRVDPKTLALLFTADRYEHLTNEIEPALKNNKIVITERYYHSTIAYQQAQGVSRKWLINLNRYARKPDVTLFIDVDPVVSASRTETDEIFETPDFLMKVRDNYLAFNDITVVDGNGSMEDTLKDIKSEVLRLL